MISYRDLRPHLDRADWTIGRRAGDPHGGTLHFNGPPVAGAADVDACIRQLQADARYHMRPDGLHADGIQYTYAALPDGTIAILRDDHAMLWHCANHIGNMHHVAIHIPIGGAQQPTPAQWAATTALFETLISRYGWTSRQAIKGHCEWPRSDGRRQKACPGPILTRLLAQWRGALAAATTYRVTTDVALIREGAGQQYRVALHGTARLPRGAMVVADAIVHGTPPAGSSDPRWVHLASQVGFMHMSVLEAP